MEKIQQIEGQIARNRRDAARAFERIAADDSLSDSGKRQQLQAAWEQADAKHRTLWEERKAAIVEHEERLKTRAFGPVFRAGQNEDVVRGQYRETVTRLAGADLDTLRRQLRVTELSGDKLGKRAVLAAAFAGGHASIVDEIADPDVHTYAEFARTYGSLQGADTRITERMRLSGPVKPNGVAGFGSGRAA